MSFAILRTNVGLTTNVRILVDSQYNLSLDSIESNDKLSLYRLKKFEFNEFAFYDELISLYYRDIPTEVSFFIENADKHEMSDNFSKQFSDIYSYGPRYVVNTDYLEEFEYFAPIYIDDGELSKYFIIFRIEENGINTIDSGNFKDEIVDKLKVVKLFDLTQETKLGRWLYKNFVNNPDFPTAPLDIDFKKLEFSNWNGINYKDGGYVSKSVYMDSIFSNEKEIFELDKLIFNGYKENSIVFPNILNLSFLYDDVPVDDNGPKKWSINRYYGFYIDDMILSYTISPYKQPDLRSDVVVLDDNILFSETNPENPFLEDWNDKKPFYVEFKGEWFLVERYSEVIGEEIGSNNLNGFSNEEIISVVVNYYKIISDKDISGKQSELNKIFGFIDNNLIFKSNNILFDIPDWDSADIWIIEIRGIYHKLIKNSKGEIQLNSDYNFKYDIDSYKSKLGLKEETISLIVDFGEIPENFKIYKLKFSDIKDFDTKVVDTEYSKFEYEIPDDVIETDETKMYMVNPLSNTYPKEVDRFLYKDKFINIPVSSEYTANLETFKINKKGDLTDLWNINPVYSRWVFKNSLSANDYPYVLNNSLIFEEFNRTTNVIEPLPKRFERNLDFFYTINSDNTNYLNHSLHIEKYDNNVILNELIFDFQRYINIDSDYFSYFFEGRNNFVNSSIKKNVKKYSRFNKSKKSLTNITLFRGIEFRIFDVDSIILSNTNQIENENLLDSKSFNNWKFSTILTSEDNEMEWNIVENWQMQKQYATGSIVVFDDILYTALETTSFDSPVSDIGGKLVKSAPYNIQSWTYSNIKDSVLWSPERVYKGMDFVYNSGEWYELAQKNIKYKSGPAGPVFQKNSFIRINGTTNLEFPGNLSNYELEIANKYNLFNNITKQVNGDNIYQEFAQFNTIQFWSPFKVSKNIEIEINQKQGNVVKKIKAFVFDTISTSSTPFATYEGVSFDASKNLWLIRAIQLHENTNGDLTLCSLPSLSNQNPINKCLYIGGSEILSISNLVADFWNPVRQRRGGYSLGEVVLFKGNYWKSLINKNIYPPDYMLLKTPLRGFADGSEYWIKTEEPEYKVWNKIQLWSDNKRYENQLVLHNGIIWYTKNEVGIGAEPGIDDSWIRKYSIVPDSEYVYLPGDPSNVNSNRNPLIFMNNRWYIIKNNPLERTLDSGIIININKKWKNILINIRIGDNTLPNLRNSNRDILYNDMYFKLTAANFMDAINDLENKYGFSNYIKYIFIEENGNINEYSFDNNIKQIPNLIKTFFPEEIKVRLSALTRSIVPFTTSVNKKLLNKEIDNISKINWWNNMPISFYIEDNNDEDSNISYTGYKDMDKPIYRYSGEYNPLFYDIELFDKNWDNIEVGNFKFDTSLTNFGLALEKKAKAVNRKGSILKLRNSENKSAYPMIGEFGIIHFNQMIFKSNWDNGYHIETKTNNNQ